MRIDICTDCRHDLVGLCGVSVIGQICISCMRHDLLAKKESTFHLVVVDEDALIAWFGRGGGRGRRGREREKEQTRRMLKGSGFLKENQTVGTAKELETADLAGMASVCGFGVGRPNNLRSGRCKRG